MNVNRYNILHDEIMKKLENEEITTEQARDVINLAFEKYIVEKATREEYRVAAFKKKYQYNPNDKTIIVDGEKYKVDLDINKKTAEVRTLDGETQTIVRTTAAALQDPEGTIIIDKNFFKLKNSERRDAMLKHEVGHQKLHNIAPNSKSKDAVSAQVFKSALEEGFKQNGITDPNVLKELLKEVMKDDDVKNQLREYIQAGSTDKAKRLAHSKALQYAKKYEGKSSHSNAKEFEADRYAANHSSEKALKKGVNETYKHATTDKSIKKTIKTIGVEASPENIKNTKKELNKQRKDDTDARRKALKDEEMKKSDVYK